MKYKIEVFKNWHFHRGRFLTPGTYRVPEDVPEAIAKRAIEDGAQKISRRKTPAPENKAVKVAENKDVDDPAALEG